MSNYKVRERQLTEYAPDPENPNQGTPRGGQMLAHSLGYLGSGRSLVAAKDDTIVAGSQTLQAAVDAGIAQVIEIETDGTAIIVHKRRDWHPGHQSARQYAYMDNRAAQVGIDWQLAQILIDHQEGVDFTPMFTAAEMRRMFDEKGTGEESPIESESQEETALVAALWWFYEMSMGKVDMDTPDTKKRAKKNSAFLRKQYEKRSEGL
jgi:hypothetical protein